MRTTSDAKENTVKLRINDKQRAHIENMAKRKSMSMSEYIRNLIDKDIHNVNFNNMRDS